MRAADARHHRYSLPRADSAHSREQKTVDHGSGHRVGIVDLEHVRYDALSVCPAEMVKVGPAGDSDHGGREIGRQLRDDVGEGVGRCHAGQPRYVAAREQVLQAGVGANAPLKLHETAHRQPPPIEVYHSVREVRQRRDCSPQDHCTHGWHGGGAQAAAVGLSPVGVQPRPVDCTRLEPDVAGVVVQQWERECDGCVGDARHSKRLVGASYIVGKLRAQGPCHRTQRVVWLEWLRPGRDEPFGSGIAALQL